MPYHARMPTTRTEICTYCATEFTYTISRGRPPAFCSDLCRAQGITDKARYCRVCTKQFTLGEDHLGGVYTCSAACRTQQRVAYIQARPPKFRLIESLDHQPDAHAFIATDDRLFAEFERRNFRNGVASPAKRSNGAPYLSVNPYLSTYDTTLNPYLQNTVDFWVWMLNNEPVPYPADLPVEAWMTYRMFFSAPKTLFPGVYIPRATAVWPWIYAKLNEDGLSRYDQRLFNNITMKTFALLLEYRKNYFPTYSETRWRAVMMRAVQDRHKLKQSWSARDSEQSKIETIRWRKQWTQPSIQWINLNRPSANESSRLAALGSELQRYWWPAMYIMNMQTFQMTLDPNAYTHLWARGLGITPDQATAIHHYNEHVNKYINGTMMNQLSHQHQEDLPLYQYEDPAATALKGPQFVYAATTPQPVLQCRLPWNPTTPLGDLVEIQGKRRPSITSDMHLDTDTVMEYIYTLAAQEGFDTGPAAMERFYASLEDRP